MDALEIDSLLQAVTNWQYFNTVIRVDDQKARGIVLAHGCFVFSIVPSPPQQIRAIPVDNNMIYF